MTAPRLEAVDLACGYGPRRVFTGVSLALEPGEVLAIVGPNGAGKTTLLKALTRLIAPQAGAVTWAGRDVRNLPPRELARASAYAPQALALADWPFTVAEFVALGRAPRRGWLRPLTAADAELVEATLTSLGLAGFGPRRLADLSGGEAQRVRLAKALAQEPRVLLLDEPTAHLDPRFQYELLQLARRLAREHGLAVALSIHDLNLAGPWADRVALLAGGRLRALGPPREVLTAETLSAAYGVPLAVAAHPATGGVSVALPGPPFVQ